MIRAARYTLLATFLLFCTFVTGARQLSSAGVAQLFLPEAVCSRGGADVTFYWAPAPGAGHQWLDLSLFDNGFADGTYLAAGPFAPDAGAVTWSGIRGELPHFWRITALGPGGWQVSTVGTFLPCPAVRAAGISQPVAAPAPSISSLERELFDGQNGQRLGAGRRALAWDEGLAAAARARAADMAARNYFSHYSPSGETAFTTLNARGIGYRMAGENIARNNYANSQSVSVALSGFMGSATHRDNLLEQRFNRVGIGVAFVGDMKYYSVIFSD
jgi:uncharacterized protein YkwD